LIASIPAFSGFKPDSFKFLGQLEKEKNNNVTWFSKNRARYQENLVDSAKSFVVTIGQFFNHLNPAIRTEPKFNKTLMRINKDMRFSKGSPYKTYFLIHFGRFKMDSEFYVYLYKGGIQYGVFLNNAEGDELYLKKNLQKYRKEIINICKKFNINNKFSFYELHKVPELVLSSFNAAKNFETLLNMKYILLEKEITLDNKLVYSPDFLTEAIKTFSNLYPLYCFAISSNPLKLIDDFEERMGVAI
jgi:uncharacterized protein (TIGR02453 family)